jgi:cathepsin D
MYCSAVPIGGGKIHTIALKSYRTSTYSDIHAGGVSKLISNGVKLTNEGELDLPATTYGPGNTKLLSDKDILWYAEIKIGTGEAEEVFLVDVDTGSSDLFIPGSMCKDNCQGHTKYDPSKSPTSKKTGKRFNLDFADKSSVRGSIYTDTVTVGTLVAEGQAIGVGEVYSKCLAKNIFSPDGLLGLGFAALSHMGTPPLMETLTRTKKIDHPMFGVRLDLARLNGDKGELTLGGYNEEHIAGSITYADVNDSKYWQVQLDHASVDNTVLTMKQNLIIDTGKAKKKKKGGVVNVIHAY